MYISSINVILPKKDKYCILIVGVLTDAPCSIRYSTILTSPPLTASWNGCQLLLMVYVIGAPVTTETLIKN